MKIVALGGSLRVNSYSAAALHAGLSMAESVGAETDICDLRVLNLPMYVPDVPIDAYERASQNAIVELIAKCRLADVMIWATPTYHGAMSGVFKNAIDYLQFLSKDSSPYLHRKAIGLVVIADPAPLAHMASCVHELRGWLAPTRLTLQKEDFSDEMRLVNEQAVRRMRRLVNELLTFRP